jgi:hypothetical protein
MGLTDREVLGEEERENRRDRNSAGAGDDALWPLAHSDVSDHNVPNTKSDRDAERAHPE